MHIINLLPKSRQKELYYSAILRGVYTLIALSLCSFVLVILAQYGTSLYLKNSLREVQASIAQIQSQVNKNQNSELKKQITQINNTVTDYKNLAAAAPKWSKVLKAFAPLPPPGVQINSFSISGGKTISITGFSPTRELVIQLYNNILHDTKDFNGIDYPFENVVQAKDIGFHFTFFINEALLK